MNNETKDSSMSGEGFLQVFAYTGGVVPVEDAAVRISANSEEKGGSGETGVIYTLLTDRDGLTKTVGLPAPPKETAMNPDSEVRPFSTYNIEVKKDGFYPVNNVGVPIFDGITSRQPVEMIPESEYTYLSPAYDEGIRINETPTGDYL